MIAKARACNDVPNFINPPQLLESYLSLKRKSLKLMYHHNPAPTKRHTRVVHETTSTRP